MNGDIKNFSLPAFILPAFNFLYLIEVNHTAEHIDPEI